MPQQGTPKLEVHMPRNPWCTLSRCYATMRPALLQRVGRSFPSVCSSLVEDAVDQAFLDALSLAQEPGSTGEALREGDHEVLRKLLSCMAWRNLRGQLRRKSSRCEYGGDSLPELYSDDTPEQAMLAMDRLVWLDACIWEAASAVHKRDPARLHGALVERLAHGGTDGEVASRHGLRRESVNHALRIVAGHLPG